MKKLKILIFTLALFIIYPINFVNAEVVTDFSSYDITFPSYINWYDNVSGNLNSKGNYSYSNPSDGMYPENFMVSMPNTKINTVANGGGATIVFNANILSNKKYLLYMYYLSLDEVSSSFHINYHQVNSSYRKFQYMTNIDVNNAVNLNVIDYGRFGHIDMQEGVLHTSYIMFSTDKISDYAQFLNVSVGTSSNSCFGDGCSNYFVGYKLVDITTYSNATLEGMIQDNQNSLNTIESDIGVLQQTQEETNSAIENQTQQQQQNHQETMDTITSTDVDSPADSFEEFESYLPENGVITELITLPISLFQKVLSSINGSCTEYNLGNLMGTDLRLPCINISNYIGTNLWNVIDVLFSGLFVLVIAKKMIKAFNNFTNMEEGDVLD